MNVKILDISSSEDLQEFAGFLWQAKIPHRIKHHDDRQELWLRNAADTDYVLEQYQRWKQGDEFELVLTQNDNPDLKVSRFMFWVQHVPVTLSLIIISLVLTLLTGFGRQMEFLHWFTFVDFTFQGQYPVFQSLDTLISEGQWWRWISPVFLHFGFMHLVFNLLWTWELGRRIELVHRRSVIVVLVLFMGVMSNISQFVITGPIFGGLSGIIFGLMAYTWLWDRICPAHSYGLPPVMMTFMVVWLIFGVSGLPEKMGLGSFANTAHLIGLLSGLLCAPLVYLFRDQLWRKI